MTVSSRETQHRLFAHFAQVAEGLGHGHRLALLEILAQGERDVETLARVTGLSVASVSQHLQRLKRTGLVTARREGRRRIYQLSSPRVSALVSALERMAEECVAEVDKLVGEVLRARDPQAPVSARELAALVKKGRVTVLDVRPVGGIRRGPPAGGDQHSPGVTASPGQGAAPQPPAGGLLPGALLRAHPGCPGAAPAKASRCAASPTASPTGAARASRWKRGRWKTRPPEAMTFKPARKPVYKS